MSTQICLSFKPEDRIFLGEGLFETMKVSKGKTHHAAMHWQRLKLCASLIGICFDLSVEAWQKNLEDTLLDSNITEGGIKAILSGGPAPRGLTQKSINSQLLFQAFEYQPSQQPVRLKTASWLRDQANILYQVKSINYLEAILARKEAQLLGFDDALFFNLKRHATEITCANFFIIKNNLLLTPKIEDGVLAGITRSRIISICEKLQIAINEKSLTKSEIDQADACFLTNSLQGIQEVVALDEMAFLTKHPLIETLKNQLSAS